jgi:hypothetical protein
MKNFVRKLSSGFYSQFSVLSYFNFTPGPELGRRCLGNPSSLQLSNQLLIGRVILAHVPYCQHSPLQYIYSSIKKLNSVLNTWGAALAFTYVRLAQIILSSSLNASYNYYTNLQRESLKERASGPFNRCRTSKTSLLTRYNTFNPPTLQRP